MDHSHRDISGPDGRPGRHHPSAISVSTRPAFSAHPTSMVIASAAAFPLAHVSKCMRDLATGRNYHFFFAWLLAVNGLIFLIISFARHIQRDLSLRKDELKPKHLGWPTSWRTSNCMCHAAKRRSVTTRCKKSPTSRIFGLIPLMVLTGLTMSPASMRRFPRFLISSAAASRRAPSTSLSRWRCRFCRRASVRDFSCRRLERNSFDDHRLV